MVAYTRFCPFRAVVTSSKAPRAMPWAMRMLPLQGETMLSDYKTDRTAKRQKIHDNDTKRISTTIFPREASGGGCKEPQAVDSPLP